MSHRIFCLMLTALCLISHSAHAGVGGGYTAAGLRGEYFANTTLTAPASFTRRDVRIRFSGAYSVAGSNTPEFKAFPVSGWSARWTGQILPRYSETYTLTLKSNDGTRVMTKAPASQAWVPLIDHWAVGAGPVSSLTATVTAVSGKPIDIQIEYRDIAAPATLELSWKSASTPEEVIDPVVQNGLNVDTYARYLFADASYVGGGWEKGVTLDTNGDPQGDGGRILWGNGHEEYLGSYRVTFKGRADLTMRARCGTFDLAGKAADLLPAGTGYDPSTNTTMALMHILDPTFVTLVIKNSQRSPSAPIGSGIADLHVYRSLEPGSDTPQEAGAVVNAAFKPAAEKVTVLRYLGVANGFEYPKPTWADRTIPANPRFSAKPGGENWESLIELANETGKDLYITAPLNADNDYFEKLAQLIAYGSDGVNPYTAPQVHPAYPPLNSNLCVYFEVGNEIWNGGFPSTQDAFKYSRDEIAANTPESKIFNFDGKGNHRTWHALRTVRASEAFRRVMGDDAFGERFRPLIEYQYANFNGTGSTSLNFLDAYFNNGDADHVPDPHPIRYYIWGGGGATYYGVGNNDGLQYETKLVDSSFEDANIPDGTEVKSPSGSGWTFTGDAGIYRLNSLAYRLEAKPTNDKLPVGTACGMRFKTGAKPLFIKQFGRFAKAGSILGEFSLLRASDMSPIARGNGGNIQVAFLAHWKDDFYYTDAKGAQGTGPIQLDANTEYIVVVTGRGKDLEGREAAGSLIASPDIQIEAPISAKVNGDDPSKWEWKPGAPGACSAGLVTFAYRTSTSDAPALATVIDGQQAGVLRGTGSISQTVNFARAGAYALQFHAAGAGNGWPGYLGFTIWCDDQPASPSSQEEYRVSRTRAYIGGFARDIKSLREEYGSAVFVVKTPGPHMIRFDSKGTPDAWTAIDDVQIGSVDAIMDSGFGAGSAFGQVASNDYQKLLSDETSCILPFGLHEVSYEAGWSLGGDFNKKPIQIYTKFMDPRARSINNNACTMFDSSGAYLNVWGVYEYWPSSDIAHPEKYPLMQSVMDHSNQLPAAVANGNPIPCSLNPSNAMQWDWRKWTGMFDARGAWQSWVVNVAKAGSATLAVNATPGAKYDLEVDGIKIEPVNNAYPVFLTQGCHGIRMRSDQSVKWMLTSITVQ